MTTQGRRTPHIVVLDADPAILEYVDRILTPRFKVSAFTDIAELNRRLTGSPAPDLLLMDWHITEDPAEAFKRNVWINPFWEDDVGEIVDLMGDDRVIFGSDWPHIEGLPEPTDWVSELQKLPLESVPKIMGGNVSELNERRPV